MSLPSTTAAQSSVGSTLASTIPMPRTVHPRRRPSTNGSVGGGPGANQSLSIEVTGGANGAPIVLNLTARPQEGQLGAHGGGQGLPVVPEGGGGYGEGSGYAEGKCCLGWR